MPRLEVLLLFSGLAVIAAASQAAESIPQFGTPVSAAELMSYVAVRPDGVGLPAGHGDAMQGKLIYAAKCAICHGETLEGVKETGGSPLVGGRGSLATAKPVKTVESYWPHATTLFDYVKRAMPFNAPGSLNDDEVYALTAYILASGHVIADGKILDASNLPKVEMPNRNGFFPDPRKK